ncbi:hypothetical protein [Paraburkholderia gardini]|uniref:hypothetical protein n=1 Tax=Paraburkholderia gardini TaxID=2823469 RepID=UPI001E5BE136|nr:hypothetical protein [Paraburkholderia gardini]
MKPAIAERAADVSGSAGQSLSGPPVDLKALRATIGQLTQRNDFLEGAFARAGLPGTKR